MPEGVYDNITQMWFGTKEKMGWIEAPQTGANVSPLGNSGNGTLLDGGAFQRNSWDAHKTYQFGWSDSASRALSSKIHSYANGTYGRGLIYFQDPMYYDTNLMPRRIADPSMSLDYEAPSWLSAIVPTGTPTPANTLDLPVQTTIYNLPAGYVHDPADGVWIAIPEGQELWLGAIYSSTNPNAGIVVDNGTTKTLLSQLGVSTSAVVSQSFSGIPGVTVYPGFVGSNASAATIAVTATTARIRAANGQLVSYQNLFTNPNSATTSGVATVRTNNVPNPNFQVDLSGWLSSGANISRSSSWFADGAVASLLAVNTTTNGSSGDARIAGGSATVIPFGMLPGRTYTISAKMYRPVPDTGSPARGRRILIFYSVNGSTYIESFGPQVPNVAGEQLVQHTFTLPANTTGLQIGIGAASTTANQETYINEVQIDESPVYRGYMDGNSPASEGVTYSWVGTPGVSASVGTAPIPVGASPTGNTVTRWRSTDRPYSGTGFTRYRLDSVGNSLGLNLTDGATGTPGEAYTMILVVRAASRDQTVTMRFRGTALQVAKLTKGEWTVLRSTFVAGSGATSQSGLLVTGSTSEHQIGDFVDIDLHALVPVPSVDQPYTGQAFSGATTSGDGVVYSWDGAPEASTSTMLSMGAIANGPWYAGEGHSGCRFDGRPTLVNYNGIGGGQVGLAASFKEVGSWS